MEQPELNKAYWNNRYLHKETGWDIGEISLPLKAYFDQLTDKNISILIPGCGNAYEAAYLLQQGFTHVTLIDIAPHLVNELETKLKQYAGKELTLICDDFFELNKTFDLIIEQTFFCALNPVLRDQYAEKMFSLLKPGGKLAGLLFNRVFDGGPPFGGNKAEYLDLFSRYFKIQLMEECYNSIASRKGTELFMILQK